MHIVHPPPTLHFLPNIWSQITEHINQHNPGMIPSKDDEKIRNKIDELHLKTIRKEHLKDVENKFKTGVVDEQYAFKIDNAIEKAIEEIKRKYKKETLYDKKEEVNELNKLLKSIKEKKEKMKKIIKEHNDRYEARRKKEQNDIKRLQEDKNILCG